MTITNQEVQKARDDMDAAIRAYADALWALQDQMSDDDQTEQQVLGDYIVISHFSSLDRTIVDNTGQIRPSPQYIMLSGRNLPAHSMLGLIEQGHTLIAEDQDIALSDMYPEDGEDDVDQ